MERVLHIHKLLLRSRRLPVLILALTLGILAGAILLTSFETRGRLREQIAGRNGDFFHALAQLHMTDAAELRDPIDDPDDPSVQLAVILQISRLKNFVMAARLFDTDGFYRGAFPEGVTVVDLSEADVAALQQFKPVSRFKPAARFRDQFLPETEAQAASERTLPLLFVNVPLHARDSTKLNGLAQFVLDGHSVQAEFARLDRQLARQGAAAFLAGGIMLAVAMAWAFRRVNQAHRILAERTQHLLQANQELALAAKTSAVGAVASHLIHGLKNPLAGLQSFVAGLGSAVADNPDTDLQQAIAATSRMQALINEVVGVLREEEDAGHYEIPLPELLDLISSRVLPRCRELGVELRTQLDAEAVLSNRVANLVALILVNLVQNAVEATPRGRAVTLTVATHGETIGCAVLDEGPGFPGDRKVFAPCRSTKDGGSGIGLAISKQLANHLGAGLELSRNTSRGCAFELTLPAALWKQTTLSVTVTLS